MKRRIQLHFIYERIYTGGLKNSTKMITLKLCIAKKNPKKFKSNKQILEKGIQLRRLKVEYNYRG
jgi:hypothetical protein